MRCPYCVRMAENCACPPRTSSMTDPELMEFLWPGHTQSPGEVARFVGSLTPTQRATYERMNDACNDLALWEEGVAPKPDYAIICGRVGGAR